MIEMDHKKKIAHLRKSDPILAAVIGQISLVDHSWDKKPGSNGHFRSLVVAIVNQQLSGKAAATILKRFMALFPRKKFPTPQDVLAMSPTKMRNAGLSKMKVSFLKDLSAKILDKTIDLKKIDQWTDEEVIDHLVQVKGIGRWTAEMFLMFSLHRDDVFSYGDLGLRNAMQKLYKLKQPPTPRQAEKISSQWKPYRTLASRYLWKSIDGE
jgi:DNA-3-methyladenine glycosylase II